jgi:EmrB/QacA subfamily drug resistance transporter
MDADNTLNREDAPGGGAEADPRRWKALLVLGLVQFILVVDITVVNVALPRIQHDLDLSRIGLAWVVDGYVLMAGGLLLLGGRLGDIFGRRRMFMLGVGVFAVASIVCGAATTSGMLISGRFVQGTGEAMAQPASLGLIVMLFPDQRERIKAIGIWGGIAGMAGVTGVIISGVLTDLASWRWIFFINVPIALFALIMVPRLVSDSRMVRENHRLDIIGAVTTAGGLVAIVYGLLQAASHPWGSARVLAPLIAGVVLLIIMVVRESHSDDPLIPLRFFRNRTRVVANFSGLAFSASFITFFFLMTLFLQQVLNYSPLRAGLSYVPLGLAMGVGIGIGTGLMPKIGVKPLLAAGFFCAAIAMTLAGQITAHAHYLTGVLPVLIILGASAGLVMPSGTSAALHEVTGQDSGLASGVQTTTQQVGAAAGLACLVTLASRHTTDAIRGGTRSAVAATEGFVLSFRVAAVVLAVCGVLVLLVLQRVRAAPRSAMAELGADPESRPSQVANP